MNQNIFTARGRARWAALRTIGIAAIAAAVCGSALGLVSCAADPIFADIEKEVALADPSIRGIVTSMVFTGDASGAKYATNGRVYRKLGAEGGWDELDLPAHRCAQLAFDGAVVYGLMENAEFQAAGVYSLSGNTWNKIAGSNSMVRIFSGNGFVYGFTHSGDEDGGTYSMYHLTTAGAGAALVTDLSKPTSSAVTGGASWFSTLAGVYDAAGALVTGAPAGVLAMTASDVTGGAFFAATASTLHRYDVVTTAWASLGHKGTQAGLASISWLRLNATSGVVLIAGASKDGFSEVTVSGALADAPTLADAHSAGSGVSSVKTADASQYESTVGQWTMGSIFADASANSTGSNDYVVYAGVVNDRGYDGLWAYYPSTRSEWNRE